MMSGRPFVEVDDQRSSRPKLHRDTEIASATAERVDWIPFSGDAQPDTTSVKTFSRLVEETSCHQETVDHATDRILREHLPVIRLALRDGVERRSRPPAPHPKD